MSSERLTPGRLAAAYAAALVTMLVIDGVWLGIVAGSFYRSQMGALMTEHVRVAPVVAFYLIYPAALVYLNFARRPSSRSDAIVRSAVLGIAAYGTYDLTALAIVRDWPVPITFIDWGYGAVISAAAGAAAYAASWARS